MNAAREIVEKLEHEYDLAEGFLGLLRSGTFDPEGKERLLSILASLELGDGPIEQDLVRHLWFLPVFTQYQKERFEFDGGDSDAVDSTLTEVVNILIDVVGVP